MRGLLQKLVNLWWHGANDCRPRMLMILFGDLFGDLVGERHEGLEIHALNDDSELICNDIIFECD
jgi:hypothetical protein